MCGTPSLKLLFCRILRGDWLVYLNSLENGCVYFPMLAQLIHSLVIPEIHEIFEQASGTKSKICCNSHPVNLNKCKMLLTHCSLVTQWIMLIRKWLVACWHQAITSATADLSSMKSFRNMLEWTLLNSFSIWAMEQNAKIVYSKHPIFCSGHNELIGKSKAKTMSLHLKVLYHDSICRNQTPTGQNQAWHFPFMEAG